MLAHVDFHRDWCWWMMHEFDGSFMTVTGRVGRGLSTVENELLGNTLRIFRNVFDGRAITNVRWEMRIAMMIDCEWWSMPYTYLRLSSIRRWMPASNRFQLTENANKKKKRKTNGIKKNATPIRAIAIRQHCAVARCSVRLIKKSIEQYNETTNFIVPSTRRRPNWKLLFIRESAFRFYCFCSILFSSYSFSHSLRYYSLQLIYSSLFDRSTNEMRAASQWLKSRTLEHREHIVAYSCKSFYTTSNHHSRRQLAVLPSHRHHNNNRWFDWVPLFPCHEWKSIRRTQWSMETLIILPLFVLNGIFSLVCLVHSLWIWIVSNVWSTQHSANDWKTWDNRPSIVCVCVCFFLALACSA